MQTKRNSTINIWMPLFIGDFLRDTMGMTNEKIGALVLLYIRYWTNGPLKDDDEALSRIVRVKLDEWLMIKEEIMSFFELEGEHWTHHHLEEQYQRWSATHAKKSEAGKKGAAARYRKGVINNTSPDS